MTMPSSPWTPSLIILYLWHLGDGLIHLLLESTYVYGCFAHHIEISPLPQSSPLPQQSDVRTFLGRKDRSYGNIHSSSPIASIWQEAAKADARYAKIDLTTLSLEIVTVALAGPLALYVAEKMRRDVQAKKVGKRRGGFTVGTCFWAVVLASGELYGGFINILPELLTGWPSVRTDDFVYLWVYVILANMVWVVLPVWVLWQVYHEMANAFQAHESSLKRNGLADSSNMDKYD